MMHFDSIETLEKIQTDDGYYSWGLFASGFKALVVGKKITDVNLDKVSGSSLTSGGWNEAITKIEAQAKV